jgi:hypothetical protein
VNDDILNFFVEKYDGNLTEWLSRGGRGRLLKAVKLKQKREWMGGCDGMNILHLIPGSLRW